MPIHTDDGHSALVIAIGIFMIGNSHPFAVRRNFRRADPVDAVKQNFTDWVFQMPVTRLRHEDRDGYLFAISGPVRIAYILYHLARRAAAQRKAGKRSHACVSAEINGIEANREF